MFSYLSWTSGSTPVRGTLLGLLKGLPFCVALGDPTVFGLLLGETDRKGLLFLRRRSSKVKLWVFSRRQFQSWSQCFDVAV